MQDIINLYERVLKSYGIVNEDGYLMVSDGDKSTVLKAGGLPMVLPTNKHISSLLDEDEDGKIIRIKQLFHPLDETVIKGDSVTMTKLKKLTEVRLANRITLVGSLLLSIAENKAHQTKTSMLINQFLVRLNEAKNPGVKDVVDNKTIEKWIKLYDNSFDAGATRFITVYSKKGGKLGTTKYNRVATIKSPLYEKLLSVEKNGKINGVSLRNKDITIFKILFEYIMEDINDHGIVTVGSNDNESPGFISLFGLYLKIMGKAQEVLKSIKNVNAEWEDSAYIELAVSPSELDELNIYKRAVSKIPREGDVIKTKLSNQGPSITGPSLNDPEDEVVPEYTEQRPSHQMPKPIHAEPEMDPTTHAINKALYGDLTGIRTPVFSNPIDAQRPAQPQPIHTPVYDNNSLGNGFNTGITPGFPGQSAYPGINRPDAMPSIGTLGYTNPYQSGMNSNILSAPRGGFWNK